MAQTLFPRIDKPGRVAALEILINTHAIGNLIREGKTFQIPSAMQTGGDRGMLTFEKTITQLVTEGKIDPRQLPTFWEPESQRRERWWSQNLWAPAKCSKNLVGRGQTSIPQPAAAASQPQRHGGFDSTSPAKRPTPPTASRRLFQKENWKLASGSRKLIGQAGSPLRLIEPESGPPLGDRGRRGS